MPTILPVYTYPTHPSLQKRSQELSIDTLPPITKLIQDMIHTMYTDDGIGLAAPQIGKNIRLIVIGKEAMRNESTETKNMLQTNGDLVLINPIVIPRTKEKVWLQEGCLSVPGVWGEVDRWQKIELQALLPEGTPIQVLLDITLPHTLAHVVQHEVDHLDGILFIEKARSIVSKHTAEKGI